MFHEGDIVEIPLPDGRVAIGWIIHISKRFKDCVGFVVFGIKGNVRDDIQFDPESGKPLSMGVLGIMYTHVEALRHYGWKAYAHQPISESKRLLTKRLVGGGVYVGDDYIGSVDEIAEHNLKPMLVMGMPVVYMEIEKAFGNETETA